MSLYQSFSLKKSLVFWQEKLLKELCIDLDIPLIVQENVHRVFNYWPKHNIELEKDNVQIVDGNNIADHIQYNIATASVRAGGHGVALPGLQKFYKPVKPGNKARNVCKPGAPHTPSLRLDFFAPLFVSGQKVDKEKGYTESQYIFGLK